MVSSLKVNFSTLLSGKFNFSNLDAVLFLQRGTIRQFTKFPLNVWLRITGDWGTGMEMWQLIKDIFSTYTSPNINILIDRKISLGEQIGAQFAICWNIKTSFEKESKLADITLILNSDCTKTTLQDSVDESIWEFYNIVLSSFRFK